VKSGFTLIEILVVIGIIALLAALTFPVFSRVRENARKTTCASNMKQLSLAFQQYVQDATRYPLPAQYQKWNNGAHWVTGGKTDTGPQNFNDTEGGLAKAAAENGKYPYIENHRAYVEQGSLFAYAKQAAIYTCPSAPSVSDKKLSYSMNCALAGLSETRIRKPGEIVLLVDEGETLNDGYFWATQNALSTDSLMTRHNGGGNLLFTDGHIKFYPFDSFPLDNSQRGRDLKTALKGDVRFLDSAFGPKGASVVQVLQDDPTQPAKTDSCGANVVTTTPAPTPLPPPV
jgi:prepilin-type N-terminal cleavage/methylation domain-containing protein/prepilin-type processing-associated H-X9-DG protein